MPILGTVASQFSGKPFGSYESISTVTVGSSGSASVTFSSIPATYTHLQIRYISRSSRADITDWIKITINSDTGNNYTYHYLRGNGEYANAGAIASNNCIFAGQSVAQTGGANMFGANVVDILDYANTNKYKTVRSLNGEDRNGAGFVYLESGVWMNTNAVSTLTLTCGSGGTWQQYSHFALYGIKGS
jgi:hypothetical protein